MAEELALEQILGDRRAVHLDEGRFAPRAVVVDRARDELLARPRLPGDEHRDAPVRDDARGAVERGAQRRTVAQDLVEAVLPAFRFREGGAVFGRLEARGALAEPGAHHVLVLRQREVLRRAGAGERRGEPVVRVGADRHELHRAAGHLAHRGLQALLHPAARHDRHRAAEARERRRLVEEGVVESAVSRQLRPDRGEGITEGIDG